MFEPEKKKKKKIIKCKVLYRAVHVFRVFTL